MEKGEVKLKIPEQNVKYKLCVELRHNVVGNDTAAPVAACPGLFMMLAQSGRQLVFPHPWEREVTLFMPERNEHLYDHQFTVLI